MKDINDWYKDKGDETLMLDWPINANSVVVDLGAYWGRWSIAMSKRHNSQIFAYEPVKKFYNEAVKKLTGHRNVKLFNYGVYKESGTIGVGVKEDSSGIWTDAPKEPCEFRDVSDVMKDLPGPVDVMCMNIEGAEYDLLDAMLARKLIPRVKFLVVQFHDVKDPLHTENVLGARAMKIRDGLSMTHDLKWQYSVWETWEKRREADLANPSP
jgi:FkbM family methyltransferase